MSIYTIIILLNFLKITISISNCKENLNFCNHCNIFTKLCAKCEKPEILVPDENGGCIGAKTCFPGKNYCYECNSEGKLCSKCEENYYKDENGGCAYSEGCEISYLGECLKCKDEYVLIGKQNEFRICKSLSIDNFKNCKEINYTKGFCNICEDGYYLSEDYKCIKQNFCKESIFGICESCINGYYLDKKEEMY